MIKRHKILKKLAVYELAEVDYGSMVSWLHEYDKSIEELFSATIYVTFLFSLKKDDNRI